MSFRREARAVVFEFIIQIISVQQQGVCLDYGLVMAPHLQLLVMQLCLRRWQYFAQVRLYKPHVQKLFAGNTAVLQKEMKEIAKKYSINKRATERLFRLKPQVFIPNTPQRAEIEHKIAFLNELEQKEPIAGVINELLFDSRHLLVSMNEQQILDFINTLRGIGIDEKSAGGLLTRSPNLIHNKFEQLYREKQEIFADYLHLSKEESLAIFLHEPFLLTCSSERLRESVCFLVERQNEVLTRERIVQLLKDVGEIFLIGRQQLGLLVHWLSGWGLSRQELWKILLEHPLLLLNHPAEIFHFKAKMFRQFRFTEDMGKLMLRKYPSILIASVRSLESKLLVARDRLKIPLSTKNLEFLSFKFMANIRPRSEMLIRGKVPYTAEDICDYLRCSQKDFLAKTGVPEDKYLQEKAKFPITTELDVPRKKCLKGYNSEKKLFEMSLRYYAQEDQILKPQ